MLASGPLKSWFLRPKSGLGRNCKNATFLIRF